MTAVSLQTLLDRLPQTWGTLALPVADLDAIVITGVAEDSRR